MLWPSSLYLASGAAVDARANDFERIAVSILRFEQFKDHLQHLLFTHRAIFIAPDCCDGAPVCVLETTPRLFYVCAPLAHPRLHLAVFSARLF
jgi:hypothetical protein